jgi:hypothetical protein
MKSKLLVVLLLVASTSAFAGVRIGIGVGVGPYYPYGRGGFVYAAPPIAPPVAYGPAPVYPGVGYSWVGGYYYPNRGAYAWRAGYWARAPYAGARWYGPRYVGGRYYHGYWRR